MNYKGNVVINIGDYQRFYKIRDNNFSFALIFSEKSFSPLEKDMNYGRLYFPGF